MPKKKLRLKSVPGYVWTFIVLFLGIAFGGGFAETLTPVVTGTTVFIKFIIKLVPILIFAALCPAIATLVNRGIAGKFTASVILWYVLSSMLSGLMCLAVSSVIFGIPFSSGTKGAWAEVVKMLQAFREQSGASLPLVAIVGAMVTGIVAVWIPHLYTFLTKIEKTIHNMGKKLIEINGRVRPDEKVVVVTDPTRVTMAERVAAAASVCGAEVIT